LQLLDNNDLKPDAVASFAPALTVNSSLVELSMAECGLIPAVSTAALLNRP
jgi:hypothetical protein